jgi:hypothetical protein
VKLQCIDDLIVGCPGIVAVDVTAADAIEFARQLNSSMASDLTVTYGGGPPLVLDEASIQPGWGIWYKGVAIRVVSDDLVNNGGPSWERPASELFK